MTAVEWLIEKLNEPVLLLSWYKDELYEQAKEMEKQQIGDAILEELKEWGAPYLFEESSMNSWAEKRMKYITETYGSKGSDEIEKSEKPINLTSSQTEISDEEIEKLANDFFVDYEKVGVSQWEVSAFIMGMKEYREQIKKKI